MAQSELDKLLKAFEEKNTSMEYYIYVLLKEYHLNLI